MKKDNQRGAATVEAVVSFLAFLFVIFTLLSIVNLCRAQMLISNAVDTVAKELSQYSYFYKMSGLQKFDSAMQEQSNLGADSINSVVSSVDGLYGSLAQATDDTVGAYTDVSNAVKEGEFDVEDIQNKLSTLKSDGSDIVQNIESVKNSFGEVADNPLKYMKSIVAIAGNEGLDAIKSHLIAAPLAELFMVKHFGKNRAAANAELEKLGVVDGLDGMNFHMSTMFSSSEDRNDMVHIVVYYKLRLVSFFDWMELEVPICKEAYSIAWLAGDDPQKLVTPADLPDEEEGDEGGEEGEGGEGDGDEGDGGEGDEGDGGEDPEETPTETPTEEPKEEEPKEEEPKEEEPKEEEPTDRSTGVWAKAPSEWTDDMILTHTKAYGMAYNGAYMYNQNNVHTLEFMTHYSTEEREDRDRAIMNYVNLSAENFARHQNLANVENYVHYIQVPKNMPTDEFEALAEDVAKVNSSGELNKLFSERVKNPTIVLVPYDGEYDYEYHAYLVQKEIEKWENS